MPIVADRPHELTDLQQWHARLMFVAWGVVAPFAVVVARFFKVLPKQDWPRQLDSQFWWRTHWIGHCLVLVATAVAFFLVYRFGSDSSSLHVQFGNALLVLLVIQIALGYFRGSKGGPTAPQANGDLAGDHYDMNLRRRVFETLHKSLGYCLILLSVVTIVMGLWQVNAPRWIWIGITCWWILLAVVFIVLQRRGYAIDTYQAIWGPEQEHPGNRKAPAGWGMRRIDRSGAGR